MCNCQHKDRHLHVPGCPDAGIGDLTSDAKGTGARFNAGKVPYELIAWRPFAMALHVGNNSSRRYVRTALGSLGEFQARDIEAPALYVVLENTAMAADITMVDLFAETARVLEYGKRKYDEWNWAKGMPWQSVIACTARHLLGTPGTPGMWDDPTGHDAESGLLHAGHVGCNIMFLLQFIKTYTEGDDRPKMLGELPF